jgi:hypothetical protein
MIVSGAEAVTVSHRSGARRGHSQHLANTSHRSLLVGRRWRSSSATAIAADWFEAAR